MKGHQQQQESAVRNLFFSFLAAILVLASLTIPPAFAGSNANCTTVQCNVFKNAPDFGIKPATVGLICLSFRQVVPDGQRTRRVVLFIYDKNGTEIRNYPQEKVAQDSFCPGRQWIEEAEGGKIVLCNDDGTATLDADLIADVLKRGGMPKGALMCLVPGGVCN